MPSVQVYRSPQGLDRLPRKYRKAILHGILAACPTVFSVGRKHRPVARKRARKCGPGWVSRLLKAGSVFRRFAGSLFLSPLSWEALRLPANVGADRFAGSFPRSAFPLYLSGASRATGKRIRKAYQGAFGPVRSGGNGTGPEVPRSRKSSSVKNSGGDSGRAPRAGGEGGTPSRDIVSPALSPGIASWRKTARTCFTASITRRAGMRPTLVPNRTPPFSSCPPPRKSI